MILQLISGGQTGVDRAALDAALAAGFHCGGWCPLGRRAEDGALPRRYPLRETSTPHYGQRTALNVRDSDGTLVLASGRPDRGTALTCELARQHGKPLLVIDLDSATPQEAAESILSWATSRWIEVLNVAGPRERSRPGVQRRARKIMDTLIDRLQA